VPAAKERLAEPAVTSPFGSLVIIANPQSGRGKAAAQLSEIERILRSAGLDYRIVQTTRPGHATEVARAALAAGERYLVAVGGDGTIHEVVNGMLEDDRPIAEDAVLGVVPAGSGCDFVKSFGLPGDAVRAARRLSGGDVRPIDVGKVTFNIGTGETTRYFLNIAEVGLGGSVVDRAARLTRWPGPARYFIGFWLTLPRFRAATVRLEADGQAFQSRAHNVVVANCRYYGGGMHISPKSAPEDGVLDVLVMAGPKSDAFVLLPKVYRGRHLPHRNIVEMRVSRVRVEADAPLAIEADGEILGTAPATFEIIQTPIRVKV
jgi:diacylglycerol kinase (ATP)